MLKLIIELQHLATKEMMPDIFTVTLDPKSFNQLRTKLVGMLAVCNSIGVPMVSQYVVVFIYTSYIYVVSYFYI